MKRTTKKKRKRKANSKTLKRDFKRGPFYNVINRKGY